MKTNEALGGPLDGKILRNKEEVYKVLRGKAMSLDEDVSEVPEITKVGIYERRDWLSMSYKGQALGVIPIWVYEDVNTLTLVDKGVLR